MSAGLDGASSIRVPLDETTNESGSPPLSPPSATAKTGPVLRHKQTQNVLNFNLDSSESYPSPHSSIYEASLVHPPSTEELNGRGEEYVPVHTTDDDPPSWLNIVADTSGSGVPVSFLLAPIGRNEHIPHELYPITEKSSLATLEASLSVKGQTSASTLRPRSPGLNGRKRKSFSLSDLPSMPERRSSPPPSPAPIPTQPHLPPPERIPTPPGLPTFGKPEAISYRLPPPKTRFRDHFRPATPAEQEYHRQTCGLPRGVVMRGENGTMVRGKFTPIVSGHLPPQHQVHRFFRAPNPADLTEPVPSEQPQPARDGRNAAGRVEDGSIPANHTSDSTPQRRSRWEPFKRCHENKKTWAQDICWFLFCCGCICCRDEETRPESLAERTINGTDTERSLRPPSIRSQLTVPPPVNNFHRRGYRLQ